MNPQILLFIIKLILGGLAAFLSILIMSKTRNPEWMMMVAGFLSSYAALVYDLLIELGVFAASGLLVFGIPLPALIFAVVPSLFFIAAFIIKLAKR
jgi:hypothetical protein